MNRANRSTRTAFFLTLLISGLLQTRVWGQEADSPSNTRELEKRVEVLEQTVGELQKHALSVFGVYNLSPRAALIGRYDRMFDPNPDGERIPFIPFHPEASSNLFLGGIDFKVSEEFSLIPNAEAVRYDKLESGTRPDTDLIPRMTFYYRF